MECAPGFVADVSGIAVDVRLFHEAGCRLVHKYRVCKDQFPHPALRGGGGGVINKFLVASGPGHGDCATNTSPHINTGIGCATRCGPGGLFPVGAACRVSFASAITILEAEPDLEQSP